jgi:PAS domain S-box-containing protein
MNFETSIIPGLLQNVAILLSFSMLYDYFWVRNLKFRTLFSKAGVGLVVGFFGVLLILTPWTLQEGLVFDTRSILLSVSGMFLGPFVTFIAMIIVSAYRVILGGPGLWMGLSVIILSSFIGVCWNKFRNKSFLDKPVRELAIMGVVVHLLMLLSAFLLPKELILPTMNNIALPVLIIYPVATVLMGLLMIKQRQNQENKEALQISEERWHFAIEGAGDGLWDWNPLINKVFYSVRWKEMLGYNNDELENESDVWRSLLHPEDRERVLGELQKLLNGEIEEYIVEQRLLCKDGTYKWIMGRGKVLSRDDDGKPLRCIGTHTDIHNIKIIEETLRLSQEQLKKYAMHLQSIREEERLLLAREIHDELGQTLVALKIDIGMFKQKVLKALGNNIPEEFLLNFDQLLELVNVTLNTTRKIMTDLRPEVLNLLGIVDATKLLVRNFSERYQIDCKFTTNCEMPELSEQQSLALYRILQEALNNIARHSGADCACIVMDKQGDLVRVTVSDNGKGFNSDTDIKEDSYGLIGIRERVSLLDGNLDISAETGNGTEIRLSFMI